MSRSLYDIVISFYEKEFGRLPDLKNPRGYNEKIQWLKLYDQMPEHTVCCDKLLARGYVAQKAGSQCLLEVYQVARGVDGINFDKLPKDYVLKTNHDSGTVNIVRNRKGLIKAKKNMRKKVGKLYGYAEGEWAYTHVYPYVFAEEFMNDEIVDYKFHCSFGEIKWVQIISDRDSGKPTEVITDEHLEVMGLHFDHKMTHTRVLPEQPECWEEMVEIAKKLSADFKYVRVDLYNYKGRAIFGELTFWPLAGAYKTADEPKFGELLDILTETRRPPLHEQFDYRSVRRTPLQYVKDKIQERLYRFGLLR